GGANPRTITAGAASVTYTANFTAIACSFTVTPGNLNFLAAGGSSSGSVVASDSGCAWTASVGASPTWVRLASGSSGTGNGSAAFTVDANTGTARTGTLTVAGQPLTVTQSGQACAYSINPTSTNAGAPGGPGTVSVTASPNTCSWTATSNV